VGQEYYDFCLMQTKEPHTSRNHTTIPLWQMRSQQNSFL